MPKNTRKDTHKTLKPPSPQLETAKKHLAQPKTSQKKRKIEEKIIFFHKMSPVSRIVPKTLKRGPFGVLQHPFCCEISKIERGRDPLETFKIFRKKVSQSRKGGKSHSFKKCRKGGSFYLVMVLYFMLEALDALKIKY